MKLIHKDIKKGEIKVKIENSEDLWYLSNLIEKGDELKGKTSRKISYGGKEGKARVEKKVVFLKIKVDSVDFGPDVLRILGKVIDGPEEIGRGSHHSFELIDGDTIPGILEKREMVDGQAVDTQKITLMRKPSKIISVNFPGIPNPESPIQATSNQRIMIIAKIIESISSVHRFRVSIVHVL